MKTKEEIEDLKMSWMSDPTWDIENTVGFEEYYDELLEFNLEIKESERQKEIKEINEFCKKYDCSPKLAELIKSLEFRISELEHPKDLNSIKSYIRLQ